MFQYFQLVYLTLNICFCCDLIETLKNPFEKPKGRLIKYMIVSILFPLFLIITSWIMAYYYYDQKEPSIINDYYLINKIQNDNNYIYQFEDDTT